MGKITFLHDRCLQMPRTFNTLRMRRVLSISLLLFSSLSIFSQEMVKKDSIRHDNWKMYRTPVMLITAGLIAGTDNKVFNKWEVRELRNRIDPSFHTRVDNYLMVTPIVAVYGLNAFGLKGKNTMANRTALLIKSEILMAAMVFPMKGFTGIGRPDESTDDAFPSGHTAQAFMAATFLHKEFGEEHPVISVLGYATATGVGALRIMNNRHWVSDVLVGAGIGLLSTNIAYKTHKYKWGKRKKKSSASVFPICGQGIGGLYMSIPIK